MKRRFIYSLLPVLIATLFASCFKEQRPQIEIDEEIIQEYIEENNLDMMMHPTGIYYRIDEEGVGETAPPEAELEVEVKYKGYLTDGTVFDETKGTDTTKFKLGGVIPGWQVAITLLKEGGKGLFIIPSDWAYGPRGVGLIPPNSVLIFEIELVGFE